MAPPGALLAGARDAAAAACVRAAGSELTIDCSDLLAVTAVQHSVVNLVVKAAYGSSALRTVCLQAEVAAPGEVEALAAALAALGQPVTSPAPAFDVHLVIAGMSCADEKAMPVRAALHQLLSMPERVA
jgi:hypothetical protein